MHKGFDSGRPVWNRGDSKERTKLVVGEGIETRGRYTKAMA